MRRLVHFTSLPSTNTYLKEWTSKSTPICSTAILTDYQKAGRGRGGNLWTADAGKNLTVSFTHPDLSIRDMEALRVHFLFTLNLYKSLKLLGLDFSVREIRKLALILTFDLWRDSTECSTTPKQRQTPLKTFFQASI